jgi:hypothetical protein
MSPLFDLCCGFCEVPALFGLGCCFCEVSVLIGGFGEDLTGVPFRISFCFLCFFSNAFLAF